MLLLFPDDAVVAVWLNLAIDEVPACALFTLARRFVAGVACNLRRYFLAEVTHFKVIFQHSHLCHLSDHFIIVNFTAQIIMTLLPDLHDRHLKTLLFTFFFVFDIPGKERKKKKKNILIDLSF